MKYKESKKIDKIWVKVNNSKNEIDNLKKQNIQPHHIQYSKRIYQYEFPRDLSNDRKEQLGIYYKEFTDEAKNKDCWYVWKQGEYFTLQIRLSNFPEELVSAIKPNLVFKLAPNASEDFANYFDYKRGSQFEQWYNIQKLTNEELTEEEEIAYVLTIGFRKFSSWNNLGYGNTPRFGNLYFKYIITINNPLKIYET